MADPIPAQKAPYGVDVVAGTEYWWCACGRSKSQPFCDGSHRGTKILAKGDESLVKWYMPYAR